MEFYKLNSDLCIIFVENKSQIKYEKMFDIVLKNGGLKDVIASLRDLYDEYLSSIPDTDPKKTQIQRTFSEDLGKQFFIFKFDPAEIETYNTYVIEIFDRANRNNKIVSNEIQGLNLKENSFFELFSFYAMLIEAQPNEEHNMQNLFLKVCKIIFYCLVAVLMFYFVVILLMLIISLIALISMK
ncbi:hypothetical protein P3W45_001608 [Vairimorpha bombi]